MLGKVGNLIPKLRVLIPSLHSCDWSQYGWVRLKSLVAAKFAEKITAAIPICTVVARKFLLDLLLMKCHVGFFMQPMIHASLYSTKQIV